MPRAPDTTDPPSAATAEPALTGSRLGHYRLLRRLAVGGMAEIFLARATGIEGFHKIVVVKRLLPHLCADEEFVRMFLDEARLAATLGHPNIAQVFDIGRAGEQYFFSMEHVPGRDLHQVARTAGEKGYRIPLELALAIVMDVCAALHHAHEMRTPDGAPEGIVHRDVSPPNVLISHDGHVKIVDFGIAKAATHGTLTREGFIKGKVEYMSPEQCRGETLDRRSDVFAIGILLHELTTGARLYRSENDYAAMRRITDHDAPPPSTVRAGYPPALEPIVMRALARDRALRYGTARELQVDLETFAHAEKLLTSHVDLARMMEHLFGPAPDPEPAVDGAPPPAPAIIPRPRRDLGSALLGGLGVAALLVASLSWAAASRALETAGRAATYAAADQACTAAGRWQSARDLGGAAGGLLLASGLVRYRLVSRGRDRGGRVSAPRA